MPVNLFYTHRCEVFMQKCHCDSGQHESEPGHFQGQVDSQRVPTWATSAHSRISKHENLDTLKREKPSYALWPDSSLDMYFDYSYFFGKRQEVRRCSSVSDNKLVQIVFSLFPYTDIRSEISKLWYFRSSLYETEKVLIWYFKQSPCQAGISVASFLSQKSDIQQRSVPY